MTTYRSRLGNYEHTPAQVLAEGMCARQARRDHALFDQTFWRSPRWTREYRRQMKFANDLLKKFGVEAVVAALRTTKGRQVFSLGLRSVLAPLVRTEQEKIDAERKTRTAGPNPRPIVADAEPPRPAFVLGKSMLSKLREL